MEAFFRWLRAYDNTLPGRFRKLKPRQKKLALEGIMERRRNCKRLGVPVCKDTVWEIIQDAASDRAVFKEVV